MAERVVVRAPAKINLYLGVGARRPDGYHDVTTVLQALEFGDELTISFAEHLDVRTDVDIGVPSVHNLAAQAVRDLAGRTGMAPDLRIDIRKRTPVGAGLGGGSSNAAAALVGAAHLWGLDASDPRLAESARTVGADVAFFLQGGTALFTDRGDVPVRRFPTPDLAITLVKPQPPVATAEAYARFDENPIQPADPQPLFDALAANAWSAVPALLSNNLAPAADSLVPGISGTLAWCHAFEGTLGAEVSGSGSAVFAVCADDAVAFELAESATMCGWWACSTRTSSAGAHVIREGL